MRETAPAFAIFRDRSILIAAFVAIVLRLLPLWLWGWSVDCVRDECIFMDAAAPLLQGESLGLASSGWLPAPLYPWLLAVSAVLTGRMESLRWLQVALTPVLLWLAARLGLRAQGPRSARLFVWLLALHPTLIFYTGRLWTESLYTLLLLALVEGVCWAREGGVRRAFVLGALLGLTALLRGVVVYLVPVVMLFVLWDQIRERLRWRAFFAVALGTCLTVGPYSVYASQRWGGPILTDATAGYVAWLGNSEFPPITYDYAIGPVSSRTYRARVQGAVLPCRLGSVYERDTCMLDIARTQIVSHPWRFVKRIPLRLSQLFNPHTFLTRHIRWHYWPKLPFAVGEFIVVYQAMFSVLAIVGGGIATVLRARGIAGRVGVVVLLYHTGVIAALYGLSRFRLPLEPIALLWLAVCVSDWADVKVGLKVQSWRLPLALLVGVNLWLLTWVWMPTAWPGLFW